MTRRYRGFKMAVPSQSGDPEEFHKQNLLDKIERWEYDSIVKIRDAATTARRELEELFYEPEARTSAMVNIQQFSVRTSEFEPQANKPDRYEEQGVAFQGAVAHMGYSGLKEPFLSHRKESRVPLHMVNIVNDTERLPIHLIKLKIMKPSAVVGAAIGAVGGGIGAVGGGIGAVGGAIGVIRGVVPLFDLFEGMKLSSEKRSSSPVYPPKLPKVSSESKSEDSLDPTQNDNLILLQISQLSESLRQLASNHLSIVNESSDLFTQSKQSISTTVVIDIFNKSWKDSDQLLDEISKSKHIHSVYIRGTPPKNDDDRQNFFSKYPIIKAMFENEQSLVVQWAMDTANKYKKIGDMYIQKGEKEKAHLRFSEGVALYKRLSTFLNEK